MSEVCYECEEVLEMTSPTKENPERRFKCPKCGDEYIAGEIISEYELGLN